MNKSLRLWWAAAILVAGSASVGAQEGLSPLPPNAGVARAAFTTAIVDGEPADQVVVLTHNIREVSYVTDLRGVGGRTVTHQWEHEGRVVSRISFEVEGSRWQGHSTRQLDPSLTGKWTVIVLDEQTGWPLHASTFRYDPAGP